MRHPINPMKEEDEMKANRSWAPIDIFIFDHEVFQSLTDTQKCAFFLCIFKSKQLRRGGEFRDRRYLAGLLGTSYGRAIPRLIAEGLLEESQSGLVTIPNYSQWQVDVTSAQRQARYRAQKDVRSRDVTTLYRDVKHKEKEKDTLSKARSLLSVGEILARGGAK
jgi:hypothetical protein